MATSGLLYDSRITGVRFTLAGSENIRKDSHVTVVSQDTYRGNVPHLGGICDARMGTNDYSYKCQTCFHNKKSCLGHPGHINLNYPVYNVMGFSEARKWLKLICHYCGSPVLSPDKYLMFHSSKRLELASKQARTGGKRCHSCGQQHIILKKHPTEPLGFMAERWEDKDLIETTVFYPHHAREVLEKITPETLVLMGKSTKAHPTNLTLDKIQVPGMSVRPDTQIVGSSRSSNDDLTTILQAIIKKNDSLPMVLPPVIDDKLSKIIWDLNNAFYTFVRAGNGSQFVSISLRIKGKLGRIRRNLLGRRSFVMARSTIVGDPRLKINEIAIPLSFAKTLQQCETIQEYNKKRIMEYILNGRKYYPGATKIIKRDGTEYNADRFADLNIENGDRVMRDTINGDPLPFGRQPSLTISAISTNLAKVMLDEKSLIIGMNVTSTPAYNADFDGDQMNINAVTSESARIEAHNVSSLMNWFLSHSTSAPLMGQVDDGIVGVAELTRSGVVYGKYATMLLFQDTSLLPSLPNFPADGLSGRDMISMLLKDTPINFTRRPSWYNPQMAKYVSYDALETTVKIVGGKMLEGVLDKASIGKGATGGLYHVLANEYGSGVAMQKMHDMQQIAISHLYQKGFTIGIADFVMPENIRQEIDAIGADMVNKSRILTSQLEAGEIIPSIGMSVAEFYESKQMTTLSVVDDFLDPVMRGINPATNNLFKLIMYGSKGKLNNLFNIVSMVGQKIVNGERALLKYGPKRSLPYFRRFDESPQSRGYIMNSYFTGMNSVEYIWDAMAARFDLISKALTTSVAGEQNRQSVKSLESIITDHYRMAVKSTQIVQFAYGEDFLDARFVERVIFPTVLISDAIFEAEYSHSEFPKFFATMSADRTEYRRRYLQWEAMNTKELFSNERQMPVNVMRVLANITAEFGPANAPGDIAELVKEVDRSIENIKYVFSNGIQERRGTQVHAVLTSACWLMQMLVRSYMHPNALIKLGFDMTRVKLTFAKIRAVYTKALVDPGSAIGIINAQCYSEPITQYFIDAHHRSASGGTSNSSVTATKEVLSARGTATLASPSMLIPVLPQYASDKSKVMEIANAIEVMHLEQFLMSAEMFFEKFGIPVFPETAGETTLIKDFMRANPLLTPPGDLINWCIRFVIDKSALILKSMSLEIIVQKLRETYPMTYIVSTPENVNPVIVRVYMRAVMFATGGEKEVRVMMHKIIHTIIRGVAGITSTKVIKMLRSKVGDDGAITRNETEWGIVTTGTNIRGLLTNRYIDRYGMITDAIPEVVAMFGCEAGRITNMAGLKNIIATCNQRVYMMYCDEMSSTGEISSITSTGVKKREAGNILLRIGFSSPLTAIEDAVTSGAHTEDKITGVTPALIVGDVPRIGTLYADFAVDTNWVADNVRRPDDIIADILD